MSDVKRFRKLPVEIDAIELRGDTADAVANWCGGRAIHDPKPSDPTDVYVAVDIPTLEGVMRASVGDYVIRGVKGEFYPCKPDIFTATYEELAAPDLPDTVLADIGKDHAKYTNWAPAPGDNTGHGHVFLRPDGIKARCGGPGLCSDCSIDLARLVRDGGH